MKVVHVIGDLNIGGAEAMLCKLLSIMDRKRFAPFVISLTDECAMAEQFRAIDVPVYSLGMKRALPSPASLGRFIHRIAALRPRLIQGWMYHGNIAALAARALLPRRPSVVWNIRGSHHLLKNEKPGTALMIRLGAKLSALPDKIINNSTASARGHKERLGYRSEKMVLIPNGFDTDRFTPSMEAHASVRAELGVEEDALLIGLFARYHPVKDHANFLRAAALTRVACPQVRFVMAGDGVEAANLELLDLIYELGLDSRAHLLGERKDMPRLLAAMDIVSLASYSEGFPNVIGESMACGVPCVVTDAGDCAWVIGDTGRVVSVGNAEALADGWLELIRRGSGYRQEQGQKARQRVLDCFSLGVIAAQYEALYSEVLRQSERGNQN